MQHMSFSMLNICKMAAMTLDHLITEYLPMSGGLSQGSHLPDERGRHTLAVQASEELA